MENIEYEMMDDECVVVVEIEKFDDEERSIVLVFEMFYEESFLDAQTYEVKLDEIYLFHDEWINMMNEKHIFDNFLFGEKESLSPDIDQTHENMFAATKLIKYVDDINQQTMSAEKNE